MSRSFIPKLNRVYLAFNKPFEVLSQFTSSEDPGKRVLAEFNFPKDVYPIGRLDYDSEGLLLLSDDGEFNQALLHPSRQHARTYLVQVEHVPSDDELKQLERGVVIQGHKTLPARAVLLNDEPNLPPRSVPIRFRKNIPTAWIELSISEGRNRQVRRMTAAIGHPTLRLMRIAIGKLRLDDLALDAGQWKKLTPSEVMLALAP